MSLQLMTQPHSERSPHKGRRLKKKKKKSPQSARKHSHHPAHGTAHGREHYRLNLAELPFVAGKVKDYDDHIRQYRKIYSISIMKQIVFTCDDYLLLMCTMDTFHTFLHKLFVICPNLEYQVLSCIFGNKLYTFHYM